MCKNNGKVTEIHNRDGSFEFDLWVKAPSVEVQEAKNMSKGVEVNVSTQNRFKSLEEEEEESDTLKEGFARQEGNFF